MARNLRCHDISGGSTTNHGNYPKDCDDGDIQNMEDSPTRSGCDDDVLVPPNVITGQRMPLQPVNSQMCSRKLPRLGSVCKNQLLYTAVTQKDLERVVELIQQGADVNSVCENSTPLCWAVQHNCENIVKCLLDAGAEVNMSGSEYGARPLHYTCGRSGANTKLAKLLLDHGANVNATDFHQYTVLNIAAYHKHADLVKVLLDHGADVHLRNDRGSTPLHLACTNSYATTDIVRFLLMAGADVHSTDIFAETPLHVATRSAGMNILNLLCQAGAHPTQCTDKMGYTALQWACHLGHTRVVKLFLNLPQVDINRRHHENGCTALHMLCYSLRPVPGPLPQRFQEDSQEPSMLQEKSSSAEEVLEVVRMFLSAGARTGQKDYSDRTPLVALLWNIAHKKYKHEAYLKMVQLFVASGCKIPSISHVQSQTQAIIDWLAECTTEPCSLKELCRMSVRQELSCDIDKKIENLPLPTSIKHYLKLMDIVS